MKTEYLLHSAPFPRLTEMKGTVITSQFWGLSRRGVVDTQVNSVDQNCGCTQIPREVINRPYFAPMKGVMPWLRA